MPRIPRKTESADDSQLSTGKLNGDEGGEFFSKLSEILQARSGMNGTETAHRGAMPISYGEMGEGLDLQVGAGTIDRYVPNISFPRTRKQQLTRVDYWLEKDDYFQAVVGLKSDFTSMGLSLYLSYKQSQELDKDAEVSEKQSRERMEAQEKLNRVLIKWDFNKITEDLLTDWFSKDTMILYWKTHVDQNGAVITDSDMPPEERSKEELLPGLLDICALNPSNCDWENSYGQDELRYDIPQEIIKKIQLAFSTKSEQEATRILIDSGIELKYIQAVKKNQSYVILSKKDGDNWRIATRARMKTGIAKPSAATIFIPLEIRKALSEGEFSASYLMKHFIMQVKMGESITQGPRAGSQDNWAKQADITAMNKEMKKTAKAQRMVTNHTVEFKFVYPPNEMWDRAKFENTEMRLLNWAGVAVVVMLGDGGTNGSGYIGIRRLIASMRVARSKIARLFFEFFDNPVLRAICQFSDDVDVRTIFDENVLKEPRQLLQEVTFLTTQGMGDPKVILSELGRDPETVRDAKKASILENEASEVWEPIYEKGTLGFGGARRSNTVGGEGSTGAGRPPNDGTTPNEFTRTQTPPATGAPNG